MSNTPDDSIETPDGLRNIPENPKAKQRTGRTLVIGCLLSAAVLGLGTVAVVGVWWNTVKPSAAAARRVVVVELEAPAMTCEEVESLVVSPAERQLMNAPNAGQVRSVSRTGSGTVWVEFASPDEAEKGREFIKDALDGLHRKIFDGVQASTTVMDSADSDVLLVAVYSPDGVRGVADLHRTANREFRPLVEQVAGVRRASIPGDTPRQCQVLIDPDRLVQYGVSLSQIREAVVAVTQKPGAALRVEDLNHAVVQSMNGRAIQLNQVARVELGYRGSVLPGRATVVAGRGPRGLAVLLHVRNVAGASMQELKQFIENKLNDPTGALKAPSEVKVATELFTRDDVSVRIELPSGTKTEEVARVAEFAEAAALKTAGVGAAWRLWDDRSSTPASVEVLLKLEKKVRPREEIVAELRRVLREIPGAQICIGLPVANRLDPEETEGDIQIQLTGPDFDVLAEKGRAIESALREIAGLTDVRSWPTPAKEPRIQMEFDRNMSATLGLAEADLAALRATLEATPIGTLPVGKEDQARDPPMEVVMKFEEQFRDPHQVGGLQISLRTGKLVRLETFIAIREIAGPGLILHEAGQRAVVISANVEGRSVPPLKDVEKAVKRISLSEGYVAKTTLRQR